MISPSLYLIVVPLIRRNGQPMFIRRSFCNTFTLHPRMPAELLDIIEAKQKEISELIAPRRQLGDVRPQDPRRVQLVSARAPVQTLTEHDLNHECRLRARDDWLPERDAVLTPQWRWPPKWLSPLC